jgi:hypothetical protein
MKKIFVLFIIAFAALSFAFLKQENNALKSNRNIIPNDSFYCRAKDFPKQEISSSEEKHLIYLREEEKMARDFYSVMNDKWGLRPFKNITRSEQRHMSAIKSMLDKYAITDPVKDNSTGIFTNTDIKILYDNFIKQGNKSEIDAFKSAAEIEEVDIIDLMSAIKDTDNDDLKLVYNNLLKASGNHLRAFVRNLDRRGINYSPIHLEKNIFEDIINR